MNIIKALERQNSNDQKYDTLELIKRKKGIINHFIK